MNILKRLIFSEFLVPASERLGDLPSAQSACGDVFKMAWPAIFEGVMLHLCSMVDTMMVGVVGTMAISAIGISGAPRILISQLFSIFTFGASAMISRRIGEGNRKAASDTLRQMVFYTICFSAVICTLSFIFAPNLLRLCGAPKSVLADSVAYFRIWLLGTPVWGVSCVLNTSFRATGNPRVPMIANIVANLANVLFNYLLISGNWGFPALGVRGAAISTMICYVVQLSISFAATLQHDSALSLSLKSKLHFDRDIFSSFIGIAPSLLFSGIAVFAASTIQTRIINSIGSDDSFSAYQIFLTLHALLVSFACGFSSASTILVGQSLGKKRSDIAILFVRLCILLAIIFSILFVVIFLVFDETIIGLYVPDRITGAATYSAALTMLRLLAVSMPVFVLHQVYSGVFQGAGDAHFLTFKTFFTLICRTTLFYFFCKIPSIGVIGTFIAMFVDETFCVIMSYVRFRHGKWKHIRL